MGAIFSMYILTPSIHLFPNILNIMLWYCKFKNDGMVEYWNPSVTFGLSYTMCTLFIIIMYERQYNWLLWYVYLLGPVSTVVSAMYSPWHEQTPRMCGHVSIYGYFPIEISCKKRPSASHEDGTATIFLLFSYLEDSIWVAINIKKYCLI